MMVWVSEVPNRSVVSKPHYQEFFLSLMLTSAYMVKTSVWSAVLFRATLTRHTNDRIHGFKPVTTSRTFVFSYSLMNLRRNAIRQAKHSVKEHGLKYCIVGPGKRFTLA